MQIHRNISRRLTEEVRTTALSEFSFCLKESGYSHKERLAIIQEGTKAYERQLERDRAGVCPLYRPKDYKQEEREHRKKISKVAWYRPHDTVLFCPPTPGSELKNELQDVADQLEKDHGTRIRIVERAGRKLKHMLPGLSEVGECEENDCFLHQSGGKGSHETESVVYQGICMTCQEAGPSSKPNEEGVEPVAERQPGTKSVSTGETSRSILVRGKQHLHDMESPQDHPENAFVKHALEYHAGEVPQYKLSVMGSFPKPLERQVWEGVMIRRSEQEDGVLMNSKLDHYAPAVGRVVISNAVSERDA